MEEAICNIDNREPQNALMQSVFTVVEALLSHPMSAAQSFLKAVDLFTEEDFKRLLLKVRNEHNEVIFLTEKELLIYYSVIYFALEALNSNAESQWLLPYYSGRESQFQILKDQIIRQAPATARQLREQFAHLQSLRDLAQMLSLA